MYPAMWPWLGAPCHAHLTVTRAYGHFASSSPRRPRGHAEMGGHLVVSPSVFLHIYEINEIIYHLLKKFLLNGDRFLRWCSTPTLHSGFLFLEFLMSSSSSGRDVVVWPNSVFRISESPYFGGCGISFWRTTLFLLRWSIALCWWSLRVFVLYLRS